MAETINMPKLGFDMAEGLLVRWVKQVGENINKGDVLAEIETDKATVEVESSASGVVLQHMVDQGTIVPVNAPIAVVGAVVEVISNQSPVISERKVEALMPRVNAEFRTQTGPAHTAVMGSSMGGLLSFYLVTHHPDVFGACGCVSTHFPLSEKVVAENFRDVAATAVPDSIPYVVHDIEAGLRAPKGTRFWFDYGTMNLDAGYGPSHDVVRAWLLREGLVEGKDFVVRRYAGADHNEASWRARLEDPLTFLFGRER